MSENRYAAYRRVRSGIFSSALLSVALPRTASAHVKWFCAFDVAGQPVGLENVLCADFEQLTVLAIAVLFAGCLMERTPIGFAMVRALNRVTAWVRVNTELVMRATCGFFFISIWTLGGIILTPELKSTSPLISWVQIIIVFGLISRRTLLISGLGIVALYGIAVRDYGIFHLMDYPIFLGIAAYLALTGIQRDLFGIRPLDLMRWTAGFTLMWASVEKWAYPEWSYPLLITHPAMTVGYDVSYYMRAAGAIEFTLAFALLWTPLVRRFAAIMLAAIFIGAISEFGKVDAIGHSGIIAVLLVVMADDAVSYRLIRWWQPFLAPVGYGVSLAGILAAYYVAHAAMFGTAIL